jgi:hypothetical protein
LFVSSLSLHSPDLEKYE